MRALTSAVAQAPASRTYGRVSGVQGLLVEVAGTADALAIGTRLTLQGPRDSLIAAEVVGFRNGQALCMPFGQLDGVRMGCKVYVESEAGEVYPSRRWLGRVINALGEPADGLGPLVHSVNPYRVRGTPPSAHARARVGGKIDLGVKALNAFTTACQGQRLRLALGPVDRIVIEIEHRVG